MWRLSNISIKVRLYSLLVLSTLGMSAVQALSKLGMDNYLGALGDRAAKQDYVDFYAYLHRVVDEKIGRLLGALGSPDDPGSLRSRTVILRTSDHGEMGLSHGGLRQKIFNAYEETIRVPLVVSNPRMFPQPKPGASCSKSRTQPNRQPSSPLC